MKGANIPDALHSLEQNYVINNNNIIIIILLALHKG